jgi:hypothetical protein
MTARGGTPEEPPDVSTALNMTKKKRMTESGEDDSNGRG